MESRSLGAVCRSLAKIWRKNRLWISGLASAAAILCFLFAGGFLVISPNPVASQAVVVLSGEQGRLAKGLELYERYGAEYLVISNANDKGMADELARLPLPEGHVLKETRAKSTLENARYVKEILTEKQIRSAIVVTSNYHSRRTRHLFQREFENEAIQLSYDFSVSGQFMPYRWWSTKLSFMITANEYAKLLGNSLGLEGEKAKRILREINNWLF